MYRNNISDRFFKTCIQYVPTFISWGAVLLYKLLSAYEQVVSESDKQWLTEISDCLEIGDESCYLQALLFEDSAGSCAGEIHQLMFTNSVIHQLMFWHNFIAIPKKFH